MILKTITFNMHHGEGNDRTLDVKRQAEFLKQYQPDVVFLQEIDMYTKRSGNVNQIYEFSQAIGLKYCSMETNIMLEGGYYGDGIVCRFPIDFSTNYLMPLTDITHEQRGILRNKISFGTTKLNLFSVHLSTHEEERILAAKQLNKIVKNIDKKEIIIVGGDFNVGKIRLGKGKYIYQKKDKFQEYEIIKQELNRLANTEDTWKSENGTACIDTMFYCDNVQLIDFKTIQTELSDHNAVYAEYDI